MMGGAGMKSVFLPVLLAVVAQSQVRDDSFSGSKAGEAREAGGVKLRWCPPGRFMMGSPEGETLKRPDEEQVEVVLSRGFWAGQYEVTQGQWKRVMGAFVQPQTSGNGDDFPVYWVNFGEAEEFCRRLTKTARDSGGLPAEWEFRLPTEAQWEYACRAGTTTATAFGDRLGYRQANYAGKSYNSGEEGPSLNRAERVGSYPPNAWGLYDLHGNIYEWTRDWYHAKLPGGVDPDLSQVQSVMNRDGTYSRVRRGGSFADDSWACRSACRLRYEPPRRSDHIGFRVVVVRLK